MAQNPASAASQPSLTTRICVLGAALFAVGVPVTQQLGFWGQTAEQFARDGDSTLRAADYAFAIWGLIYAGLIAYAIYQLVAKRADGALRRRFALPSIVAMTGCGFWLIAAGADWTWATVIIIVVSAIALITASIRAPLSASRSDAIFITIPLSLLAGWLSIASIINALTVLTVEGFIDSAAADAWALTGVAFAALIVAVVFFRSRSLAYLAPPIWGLIAVYIAEQSHRPNAALLALGAAVLLAALAAWALLQRR